MVLIPDFSKIYCIQKYCLRYSYAVFLIVPVVFLMYWFIRKTFVKFPNKLEQQAYIKTKKPERKVIFLLRSLTFVFLIIAIASPFVLESRTVKGNPRLTILIDNSSSMNLYNPEEGINLYKKLEGVISVNIRTIATGDESPIGNGVLNNMEGGDNILAVTDGNSNKGKLLGDIMLLAQSINATISTLDSEPVFSDVSVAITGQHELIKDSEGDFSVNVNVVGKSMPYTLQVLVDNDIIIQQQGKDTNQFKFERKFSEGKHHKIEARLIDVGEDDYFKSNNVYYKSIKVVPRPKLLFVAQKESPLASNIYSIYDVDIRNSIPNDISEYMGVILNNLPAGAILPYFDMLNDYVVEGGNGLMFIGGDKAYESGGYKGTLLETLLPVKIGAGEEENKSDVNIAVVIDISHGTQDYISVEKALAISVLDSLHEKNNVGAVAFGHFPCKAYKIAGIEPLKEHKKELVDKIASLKFDGQSCFDIGIQGGYDLLKDSGGGKNIIFISDGKAGGNTKIKTDTIEDVRQVNARGVRVYTVGVGTETDENSADNILFLSNIAVIGRGIFFKADASNRLKILFGKPGETKEEKDIFNSLVVLDSAHFITEDLGISATIGGYNYVIPKPSARLLITTNKKIPFLTVWRFGLGRVVSFSSDDGTKWGGELLNKKNSKLITRSINWAIGDLGRKQAFDVTIKDTTLGKKGYVNVISKEFPKHEKLSFAKIDANFYSADFIDDEAGFKELMGATYAVNYNDEYAYLGINKEFIELVKKTGGMVFKPDDIDGILEFVKSKSKRIKIDSIDYRWPFVIAALALFLLDIAYRRRSENKKW